MKEQVYKTQISDIKLEATIFEPAFFFENSNYASGIMAEIKRLHKHSTYEIFFVLKGSLVIGGEHEKSEHENSIVIIPPHFDHYTVSNVQNGYCMYFRIDRDQKIPGGLFSSLSAILSNKINVVKIDEDIKFFIRLLAHNVEHDISDEDNDHIIALLFSAIFKHFRSHSGTSLGNSSAKHTKYLFTIDNYIDKNYTKKIRLEDLAAELFLCPKQVSRIIHKEYGCSLSDLVNRRKLTVARMLIKNTNLDIIDIASMVGFEYENYFFTLFKKEYGISPMKFREDPDEI